MKRIISILALVFAMTMLMSIAAFAAPEFSVEDTITLPGGTTATTAADDDGVTVIPAADNISVTVPATANADYSILLVKGNSLPTVDSEIAYINQENATSTSVAFSVLPLMDNCDEEMMLYIGTNATGESLISVPVSYAEPAPANDYITSTDTSKGTIKKDVNNAISNESMGIAVGNNVISLALDTAAYPAAGNAEAGYIVKAVNADGTDITGASVFYSAQRKKYVALIPSTVVDYKFEIIAAGTEGAAANGVILYYGDMNESGSDVFNGTDLLQFRNVYKKANNSVAKSDAKKALIADVDGNGTINGTDLLQFRKAYKKDSSYNFAVLNK